MAKKAKPKGKEANFERYFVAIQQDLTAIQRDMATKKDLEQFATKKDLERFATKEEMREIRADVKMITETMASRADLEALREELLREIKLGRHDVDELRERVAIIEGKLGIAKHRRAA